MILAAATLALRRLRFEWLAWQPGRVEVADFHPGGTDADVAQLTARFRDRLSRLHLQSSAPLPGSAPERAVLDVLESGDTSNPWSILMRLPRAGWPTHAYEVRGTLVLREEAPRYGITVQVVRHPSGGAPPDTIFADSWERAASRAADRATAHILPRTRRCTAPWASWRGFQMPPELLEDYEAAVELESALGDTSGHPPLTVSFPRYEEHPVPHGHAKLAARQLQRSDERLRRLADVVAPSGAEPGDFAAQAARWADVLSRLDDEPAIHAVADWDVAA